MKIGFLITARLKSSRLPLKLLKDLNGKTVVERVIDRAKKVAYVDGIVLCTSTNPQDKPLVDLAIKNEIYYFLGSEEDVLQRLTNSATFFGYDYFINITGENPLFSIEYANILAEKLRSGQYDFSYLDGLPIGCAVYGLATHALKVICEIKDEIDTEIWGLLINRPDIFRVLEISVANEFRLRRGLRLTTDYIEDFQLISAIFNRFESENVPTYLEVVKLMRENPDLMNINAMHKQLALDEEVVGRINEFYQKNKTLVIEMLKSKQIV